jgi:lysozyme
MAIELQRRRPPGDHIVTDVALGLIKGFEGLHLSAYPDPASPLARTGKGSGDPWTIGWGRTKGVKRGDRCTLDEANAWLKEDADMAAQIVRDAIQVPLTAGEFAALVSLAYNLGYLPPSLKACLNGGTTDKGKVMAPGSYADAILQLPRNCRAQTRPMKGLYRRRLAEACVFSDLPWEDACSVSIIQFELDERGEIDTDATTSLEDTLMRARSSRAPDPGVILKKPWSELVKAEPAPAKVEPEPAPPNPAGKAEPLETAAPKPPAPAVSAPVPVQPSGPAVAGPAAVVPAPQLPPPPVAPPSAGGVIVSTKPPEPVIIAPKSVDVRSIPYGEIAPENGAKNMSVSQRGVGMVLVGVGSVVQIITMRLGVGTAVGAIFFDLSRDPVVIALVATGIVAGIGWLTRKRGTKVMTTGMVNATQVLK